MFLYQIFFVFILFSNVSCKKPNVILIVADDVGRNDFGIHGSNQIPTPNIDALGYNGIILNRHYTMHICTPSRAALLTGINPIRAGLQGSPIAAGEPRSLPLDMPTIAERFSDLGYTTHLIGKWHLGHQNRSVTPPGRGFHSYFGYWNGFVGYFDYRIFEVEAEGRNDGYDLHKNDDPAFNQTGKYATDLFTEESIKIIKSRNPDKPFLLIINHLAGHTGKNGTALETPNVEEVLQKYSHIKEPKRRIYADIINRLDSSVGDTIKALEEEQILEDSIIVFMSDNGATSQGFYENFGSNWPLRGQKSTLFEGAIRNIALIWSKNLKQTNFIENNVFHITDWLPTLYSAAGGNVSSLGKIDGIDQWSYLTSNILKPPRQDILLNIDEKSGHEAILSSNGNYKLLKGTHNNGVYDDYFGDSGRSDKTSDYNITAILTSYVNSAIKKINKQKNPLTKELIQKIRNNLEIKQLKAERKKISCVQNGCLFDLVNDPTETTDISKNHPEIVKNLEKSLNFYRSQLVPSRNAKVDPNSNPEFCFDTWFTWLDPNMKCFQEASKITS